MKKRHLYNTFVILIFFVGTVFADGIYLGTLLGETSAKYEATGLGLDSADIRYQGFSGRYFLGYNLPNNFSVEAGWLHVNKISVLNINKSNTAGKIDLNSYGILGRFGLQINHLQELFLKFGAAYTRANTGKTIQNFK